MGRTIYQFYAEALAKNIFEESFIMRLLREQTTTKEHRNNG